MIRLIQIVASVSHRLSRYSRAFETLGARLGDRSACKITVELLALAHERGCERELAEELGRILDDGALPDPGALRTLFAPDPARLPSVHSRLLPLAFLSPRIVDAILAGRQPVDLTAQRLSRGLDLPMRWDEQETLLGF